MGSCNRPTKSSHRLQSRAAKSRRAHCGNRPDHGAKNRVAGETSIDMRGARNVCSQASTTMSGGPSNAGCARSIPTPKWISSLLSTVGINRAKRRCAGATVIRFPCHWPPSVSCVIRRVWIPVLTMRQHRGRAWCVTKGARRVRRGASGNLQGINSEGAGCQLSNFCMSE